MACSCEHCLVDPSTTSKSSRRNVMRQRQDASPGKQREIVKIIFRCRGNSRWCALISISKFVRCTISAAILTIFPWRFSSPFHPFHFFVDALDGALALLGGQRVVRSVDRLARDFAFAREPDLAVKRVNLAYGFDLCVPQSSMRTARSIIRPDKFR